MSADYQIQSWSFLPVVGQDLTERLNVTTGNAYNVEVEASFEEGEPVAAGFSEIAFTILATGATGLIFKFFEPLVTHAGDAWRDEVLRLLRDQRRSKESGRSYVSLRIALGESSPNPLAQSPVNYYFHGKIDKEELLNRLDAANKHIRSIPPEFFRGHNGPPENGFFWDDEQGQWRGTIWRYPDPPFGEFWFPPNLFDEEDA